MNAMGRCVVCKDDRGLRCPRCGCRRLRVVYTRRVRNGRIFRCRECRDCRRRMVTCEDRV